MQDELKVDDMEGDVAAAMAELRGEKPAEAAPAETAAVETGDKPVDAGQDDKAARDDGRDEFGRFKAKDAKDDGKAEGEPAPAEQVGKGDVAAAQQAADAAKAGAAEGTAAAPPSSWPVAAKAAWDQLPPAVQAAVAKRESEVASGFAQYQEFQGLKPYAEMATRAGTTLATAFDAYTKLDFAIQENPVAGLAQLAQNMRWSQAQAAELFAKAAEGLGHKFTSAAPQPGTGGTPAGQGAGDGADPQLMQMLAPVLQQHLAPHLEKIAGLEKSLQQRTQADQTAQQRAAEAISAEFAADPKNRYYANLEQDIGALLTTGLVAGGALVKVQRTGDMRRDLQAAYDQACKLHPEVSAELSKAQRAKEDGERKAREKEAAEKAKAASKSLTGNRMPGSTVKVEQTSGGATDDIEADVRAAMRTLQA